MKPCRVCGGTDFSLEEWELEFENVTGVECKNCLLSAPSDTWNRPTHSEIGTLLASEKNEPINYRGFDIRMQKELLEYAFHASGDCTNLRGNDVKDVCKAIDDYHGAFTGLDTNEKGDISNRDITASQI